MKVIRTAWLALALATAAFAQTKDLGMGAFANESGNILLAVDAAWVNQSIDSPYVMFYAFMGAKDTNASNSVAAKDVVMVFKGQEYRMPTVKELRADYGGGSRDLDFYRRLGKQGIIASWVRFYDFTETANFFPPLTLQSTLAVSEGHMSSTLGFMTPLYFKNPGFAKGDTLTIKVRDSKNAEITGECEVVLD